ncbi:hypothetical protein P152DRAFT_341976 [Eremomyces bilateralis CBS 781.70]|uniref:Uncharacterized protein n=1 Tax=Eremomyces bilateralis CBS 781.70 TaxID=1392243 RepID=A0A6G1G338_9PEZI|nr:uncharacterized protein P152DRAFT_341976 [Eremomyces bilateralis CBS 781.70]KAF1812525.1 hypothetical protein P152DRAFT_341976 [Eremomyces bilateralis CBS 781.70]
MAEPSTTPHRRCLGEEQANTSSSCSTSSPSLSTISHSFNTTTRTSLSDPYSSVGSKYDYASQYRRLEVQDGDIIRVIESIRQCERRHWLHHDEVLFPDEKDDTAHWQCHNVAVAKTPSKRRLPRDSRWSAKPVPKPVIVQGNDQNGSADSAEILEGFDVSPIQRLEVPPTPRIQRLPTPDFDNQRTQRHDLCNCYTSRYSVEDDHLLCQRKYA